MKVLIYFESQKAIARSGIGRAQTHQLEALRLAGIQAVTDPRDTYDIAHINTYWPGSQRLFTSCRSRGIPVVVHGHSTFEDFRNSFRLWQAAEPFYDASLKRMYSRADLIIAPTSYAAGLISSYPFVSCPVVTISNGVKTEDYVRNEHNIALFRNRFGIAEGEPFVMGVGFPFERKGIDDFFRIAARMKDVRFIWFGSLQRILTNTKVLKWIRQKPDNVLMPGYCSGDLIRGAYSCATALFVPSREETEGIVTLEALAAKCPIVARDIPVYDGWLKDGYNARICSDRKGFYEALTLLVRNGPNTVMLENGFQTAKERELSVIGQKLKAAYESLPKYL